MTIVCTIAIQKRFPLLDWELLNSQLQFLAFVGTIVHNNVCMQYFNKQTLYALLQFATFVYTILCCINNINIIYDNKIKNPNSKIIECMILSSSATIPFGLRWLYFKLILPPTMTSLRLVSVSMTTKSKGD